MRFAASPETATARKMVVVVVAVAVVVVAFAKLIGHVGVIVFCSSSNHLGAI